MDSNRIGSPIPSGFIMNSQAVSRPESAGEKKCEPAEGPCDQLSPSTDQQSLPRFSHAAAPSSIDMTAAARALSKTQKARWEFSHKGDMVQEPLIADGAIYISAYTDNLIGKTLYAIDEKTGNQLWEIKEKSRTSGFAVKDGVCYYGSEAEKKLFALDAKTGKKLWEFQAPDGMISDPVVHDGVVYAGDYSKNFHAVDIKTGEELWSFKTRGVVTGRPVVSDDVIYVGCHGKEDMDNGAIYALSTKRKGLRGLLTRVLWKDRPDGYHGMDVTIRGNNLYLSTDDGNIVAMDKESGDVKWKSKPWEKGQMLVVYPSPVVAGDSLYCSRVDGTIFSLDANTGDMRWKTTLPGNIHGSPQERNGVVYIGAADKQVHAIDGKTGQMLNAYPASGRYDPAFMLGEDTIYVSHGGKLSASLYPDSAPDAEQVIQELEDAPQQEKAVIEELGDTLSVDGVKLNVRRSVR